MGPRPSGSQAHRNLEHIIEAEARRYGWTVSEDAFTAQTPEGAKPMRNIVAKLSGKPGGKIVVITGHYDTKIMHGERFVGANDGGSSTGFLMEMARVLAANTWHNDVYLVWLDGEEAVKEWTDTDSLYGSRHLAAQWKSDGTLARIKALINVDMIGDRDLEIVNEMSGAPGLRNLIWTTAARLGYGRNFLREPNWIGDDHMPFVQSGVPAIDLIDFNYGPNNEYWHSAGDTMDKLAAGSFKVVGDVLVAVLRDLDR